MNTKVAIAMAIGTAFGGFIFGANSMQKVIKDKLETAKPLIVNVIGDVMDKARTDQLTGEALKVRLAEELDFIKIAMQ
jgi:hypothetical protein